MRLIMTPNPCSLNKNDIMPTPIGNNNTIDNFDQSGDIFRELQMS